MQKIANETGLNYSTVRTICQINRDTKGRYNRVLNFMTKKSLLIKKNSILDRAAKRRNERATNCPGSKDLRGDNALCTKSKKISKSRRIHPNKSDVKPNLVLRYVQ